MMSKGFSKENKMAIIMITGVTTVIFEIFSYAILTPAIVYLADEMMYDEDKNKGQTFIGMAVTSGLILGSYVGGQLITSGGIRLLENGCVVIAVISFIFAVLGNIVK